MRRSEVDGVKTLKRYLSLYRSFLSHNLKNEMIYRTNFLILIVMDFFFMGVNVVFFALILDKVESIGGWNFNQMLILIGTVGIVREMAYLTFRQGFLNIGDYIRTGEFDLLLVKPVSPQFHLGFRHISLTESLGEGIMGVLLVVTGYLRLPPEAALNIPVYIVFLLISLVIYYSFCLIVNSAVFWIIKSQELNTVVYYFMETARYPRDIFKGFGKALFTFVIPVSLIATTPASILAGKTDPRLLLLTAGVAAGLLLIGTMVWRVSIRHYSSASS
ncbi:MAG TPA: ABC-2 family transporter protein [Nitrospiria bacterium]|nr:ABC-2 family transporter protein [Nitrospiria bacterium]